MPEPDARPIAAPARSWDRWQLAGGLALIGLGLSFTIGGLNLGLGAPFRPGAGAFPFFSGAILLVLAVAITLQDLRHGRLAERPDWMSFAAIGAALATFAITAERAGLLPATVLTVLVASAPDKSLSWPGKLLLGLGMAGLSYFLFIQGLGLPFQAVRGL